MLIKKVLENIPIHKIDFDSLPEPKKGAEYINSYINKDSEHGNILVVDFYDNEKGRIRRFFSDGQNGITLEKDGSWNNRMIDSNYYMTYFESKKSKETTTEYLKGPSWESNSRNVINQFLSNIAREKRQKSEEKKYELMKEHMGMFPGVPKDFEKYCENHVFSKRYVVFEKDKTGAACQCLHCGKKFKSKEKLKHKQKLQCPKCKSEAIAIAKRWQDTPGDKAKVCIINKVENNLITVWLEVKRNYYKDSIKPIIRTSIYYYDVLINNQKRYYYKYNCSNYYWGSSWNKTKWSNQGDEACVYVNNINSVYENGITPYGLDLNKLIDAGPVDFISLVNASATTKHAKTLYQLCLYNLASKADYFKEGEKFHEVLEINKAYLPLLRKYNVTYSELIHLREIKKILNTEQMDKFISLTRNPKGGANTNGFSQVLKLMSIEKILNYFNRQLEINKAATSTLFDWYCDYISMSNELNKSLPKKKKIDMSATILRYPRNIKQAHDGISLKVKVLRNKKDNNKIKKLNKEYSKKYSFENNTLLIQYPEGIEDFVREGASLSHCVGNNPHYSKAHAQEEEITIFIRDKKKPDKPYYTATFHTDDFRLKECYGKSHKTAPESISKFLKSYAEFMKEKYLKDKPVHKAA